MIQLFKADFHKLEITPETAISQTDKAVILQGGFKVKKQTDGYGYFETHEEARIELEKRIRAEIKQTKRILDKQQDRLYKFLENYPPF